ncbi:MAG: hypothetical protein VX737_00300 [Pseudomonadota bacterium]|nr:hypothetical protein [Pseudomonadota bacterium]
MPTNNGKKKGKGKGKGKGKHPISASANSPQPSASDSSVRDEFSWEDLLNDIRVGALLDTTSNKAAIIKTTLKTPNQIDRKGRSLWDQVAKLDNDFLKFDELKTLIPNAARLETKPYRDRSPLEIAFFMQHTEAVKLLCYFGYNTELISHTFWLHSFIRHLNPTYVKDFCLPFILKTVEPKSTREMLHKFDKEGYCLLTRTLQKFEHYLLNAYAKNPDDQALSQYRKDIEDLCLSIIEHGFNPSHASHQPSLPLNFAIKHSMFDLTAVLLKKFHYDEISILDKEGHTPLMCAIMNQDPNLTRELLKFPCATTPNTLAQNPLHIICTVPFPLEGAFAIIELLTKANVSFDQVDANGNTPVMQACISQHPTLALKLLEKTNNLTAINAKGEHLLTMAIESMTLDPEFQPVVCRLIGHFDQKMHFLKNKFKALCYQKTELEKQDGIHSPQIESLKSQITKTHDDLMQYTNLITKVFPLSDRATKLCLAKSHQILRLDIKISVLTLCFILLDAAKSSSADNLRLTIEELLSIIYAHRLSGSLGDDPFFCAVQFNQVTISLFKHGVLPAQKNFPMILSQVTKSQAASPLTLSDLSSQQLEIIFQINDQLSHIPSSPVQSTVLSPEIDLSPLDETPYAYWPLDWTRNHWPLLGDRLMFECIQDSYTTRALNFLYDHIISANLSPYCHVENSKNLTNCIQAPVRKSLGAVLLKITAQKVSEIDDATHKHELRSTFNIEKSYPKLNPNQVIKLKTIFPPSKKGAGSWIESLTSYLLDPSSKQDPKHTSLTDIFLQCMHEIIWNEYTIIMQKSVDVTILFKSILLLHVADDPLIRQRHLGLLAPFLRVHQSRWETLTVISALGLSPKSSAPSIYERVLESVREKKLDVSQTLKLANDILSRLESKDSDKGKYLCLKVFKHITTSNSFLNGNKVLIEWLKLTQPSSPSQVQALSLAASQDPCQPAIAPLYLLNYCIDQHQQSDEPDFIDEIFKDYVAPHLTYDLLFEKSPNLAMIDYLLMPGHLALIHDANLKKALRLSLDQRIVHQKTNTPEEMRVLGAIDSLCDQLKPELQGRVDRITSKVKPTTSATIATALGDKDSQIIELRQKLTILDQEASKLRKETKSIKTKPYEELTLARQTITDLETKLANTNADLMSCRQEVETLVRTSKKEKSGLSQLRTQLNRAEEEYTTLIQNLKLQIKEQQALIKSLESEKQGAQSKIKLLESQNTSHNQTLVDQTQDKKHQAQLLEEQSKQLDMLTKKNQKLVSEATSLRQKKSAYQSQIQSLEAQIQDAQTQAKLLEKKDQELAKSTKKNQNLESEVASLRQSKATQSQRILELEAQLQRFTQHPACEEVTSRSKHTSTNQKPVTRKGQRDKLINGISGSGSLGFFSGHCMQNHSKSDDNRIHDHLFQLARSLSNKSSTILWNGTSAICYLRALYNFPVQHMTFNQLLTQYENINLLVESASSLESIAETIRLSLPNSSVTLSSLNRKITVTIPFEGDLCFTIDVKLSTKINLRHYPSSIYFSWNFKIQEWRPGDFHLGQHHFLFCYTDTSLEQLTDENHYSLYWSIHQWIKTFALGYAPDCTLYLLNKALSKQLRASAASELTRTGTKSLIANDILSIIKKFINTPYQQTCFNCIASSLDRDETSLLGHILPDGATFDPTTFYANPKLTNAKSYTDVLIALKSIWKVQETNPSLLESKTPFDWSSVVIESSPQMAKGPSSL